MLKYFHIIAFIGIVHNNSLVYTHNSIQNDVLSWESFTCTSRRIVRRRIVRVGEGGGRGNIMRLGCMNMAGQSLPGKGRCTHS